MSKQSDNWYNVKIEPYTLTFSLYDVPQYFPCAFCKSESHFVLQRNSVMTGRMYSDYICGTCAKNWGYPQIETIPDQYVVFPAREFINVKRGWMIKCMHGITQFSVNMYNKRGTLPKEPRGYSIHSYRVYRTKKLAQIAADELNQHGEV